MRVNPFWLHLGTLTTTLLGHVITGFFQKSLLPPRDIAEMSSNSSGSVLTDTGVQQDALRVVPWTGKVGPGGT